MTEAATATLADKPQTPTDGQSPAATPASTPSPDPTKGDTKPVPDSKSNQPGPTSEPTKSEDKPAEKSAEAKPPVAEWKGIKADGVVPSVSTAYEKAARESGMSSDAAQKMLDSLRVAVTDSAKTQREDAIKSWQEQLRSHQTLGGEKFEANDGEVQKALNEFGNESLRNYLNETGLRFHPDLWNLLRNVQLKVGGDRVIPEGGKPTENDAALAWYPSMRKG